MTRRTATAPMAAQTRTKVCQSCMTSSRSRINGPMIWRATLKMLGANWTDQRIVVKCSKRSCLTVTLSSKVCVDSGVSGLFVFQLIHARDMHECLLLACSGKCSLAFCSLHASCYGPAVPCRLTEGRTGSCIAATSSALCCSSSTRASCGESSSSSSGRSVEHGHLEMYCGPRRSFVIHSHVGTVVSTCFWTAQVSG
jgi:hypothetical protein